MDVLLEFLKKILVLLTSIGTVVTIAIYFIGDKKTKIERKLKMNEFRNISFDFLVHVFSDYGMTSDNFPFSRGRGIDDLIGNYRQEFAKYEPFLTCLEKRRYRKYTSMAHNYNTHWQSLTSANKSNKIVHIVLHDQKELIKQIEWLSKKTGREQEAKKLKKDYET